MMDKALLKCSTVLRKLNEVKVKAQSLFINSLKRQIFCNLVTELVSYLSNK